VLADAYLVAEDGLVVDVGSGPPPAADERIDGHGRVALPGFVDSHTHALFGRSRADEFERRLVAGMRALVVGDPMDPATDVGPLANEAQVKSLTDQVERSVGAGARLLTGGLPLDRAGYYFAPGVLTNISPDSPAYREEVFGPIALLFRARDIDEAIHIANDSPFGLGSSAWTTDERERDRFIGELEAGMVFINGMVASDPRLPFGGIKQSGYGRELSIYGMREFVNIKTVWINGGAPAGQHSNAE